ncbi:DapH/DapD/GlmU-related protein [Gemella cuniculi]|uniref:DapH/DapD/GlmU-related protein n=1 Tax=Gemella cuniculi TaxID=150240 RepID=UPI000428DBF1|nr:DapH/DapD/GlmU-related protein [Gemella cuniculi]
MNRLLEKIKSKNEILEDDKLFLEIHKIKEENEIKIAKLNYNFLVGKKEKNRLISEIIDNELDDTVEISLPFQTDYGQHITFGKNIFINKDVMFVDLGGIELEDNVLIGPRSMLVTVSHILDKEKRRGLVTKSILIKNNAWLGANVTILPGVTIGENSVVAAGSIVTKDVPANSIVAGSPAKVIKNI